MIPQTQDPVRLGHIHYQIGKRYFRTGQLNEANTYTEKSYAYFKSQKVDTLVQAAANLWGIINVYQGQTDTAIMRLKESNYLARKANDSSLIASTYSVLSNIYNDILHIPEKAFLYIDSAEQYYSKNAYKELIFGRIVKGGIFQRATAYDMALKSYFEALDLSEHYSNQKSSIYSNIGTIFKSIGDYQGAKKYHLMAIKAITQQKNVQEVTIGINHHNLSIDYRALELPDSALIHSRIAIDLFIKSNALPQLFQSKILVSEILFEQEKIIESHDFFDSIDTNKLSLENKLRWYGTACKINHSSCQHEQMRAHFEPLIHKVNEDLSTEICQQLYNHYKSVNNTNLALRFKEVYSDIKDSILAKEKVLNAHKVQLERIVDEKDQNIQEEKQRNVYLTDQFEQETERKMKWMYISIISLLIGIVIVYIFVQSNRNKNQKIKLQKSELKNEKVKRNILIHKLDSAKYSLDKKSLELQQLMESSNNQEDSASSLIDQLNERNWASFMAEFEIIHPMFFENLKTHLNADLSKNERRLCALIKLNLTNKEMAEYVFVTQESIKKAKNRLYKKFSDDMRGQQISELIKSI